MSRVGGICICESSVPLSSSSTTLRARARARTQPYETAGGWVGGWGGCGLNRYRSHVSLQVSENRNALHGLMCCTHCLTSMEQKTAGKVDDDTHHKNAKNISHTSLSMSQRAKRKLVK
ncbi:hypothetical protein BO85DRAFT_436119 [Aspergillus piperis CBS 112811]|uniref:Uncharacterized protein n=1 Tax=Aspergillus piperis CBS 112811 TaxID=1448313 RepID=A0A8G1R929_9EURO|nr:hypothetical protein BO85DRAFT_436119 [Aspergillus piperis CBS 112811]RAH60464.1 hypothetical protein BO85DRAFT_436119 [Aspergillus piperis CBS 112811]